jgi:ribosomal protein L3
MATKTVKVDLPADIFDVEVNIPLIHQVVVAQQAAARQGTRMAGRMGVDTVTTQNLTVHAVDADKGLILVKGAVPGPKGGVVFLKTAAKGDA